MPLFKRKDKTTIAELEEYYSNQNKNSSGRAWFMALLSLLITLAVLAALFFGGRWLYRLVTNDDAVSVTTSTGQSEQQQGDVPAFGDIRTDSDSNDTSDNNTDAASDNENSDDSAVNTSDDNEGVVSDEAASTTRDVAGTNTDSDTLAAEDTIVSTTEIPNTGANELIALLPLLTLVIGYRYSRNRQLNK